MVGQLSNFRDFLLKFLFPGLALEYLLDHAFCMKTFLIVSFLCSLGLVAGAQESRTFFTLTSGNGHGFQVYDTRSNSVVAALDHPFRFIQAPADLSKDGLQRRNLLQSFSMSFESDGRTVSLDGAGLGETIYLDQTNIIWNSQVRDGQPIDRYFFSPFGLERNAFVTLIHTPKPSKISFNLAFNLGANPVTGFWEPTFNVIAIPGENLRQVAGLPVWVEAGHGLGNMLYMPLGLNTEVECLVQNSQATPLRVGPLIDRCVADALTMGTQSLTNAQGWAGMIVAYVEDASQVEAAAHELVDWRNGRAPQDLLKDARAEWDAWRKPAPAKFKSEDEKNLWRQSETFLRMAQVREPNIPGVRTSRGMVLASLSPGIWATGWVRDGAYATAAMARSGHVDEARASLNFLLNTEKVGLFKSYLDGVDYRISVTRYYGSGQEEADYSGASTPNVETDGWGLTLWAIRQYVDTSGDVAWLSSPTRKGSVYEAIRDGIVHPIETQLEERKIMKADSSIWEVHVENARHFLYTSVTAARGLCDFAALAGKMGHVEEQQKYAALAEEVRQATLREYQVEAGNLVGALERTPAYDIDGSVAEAFSMDIIKDFDGDLAKKTVAHLESSLRVDSGGFKRIGGTETFERYEWPFIDFRMIAAFRRTHQAAKADAVIDLLVRRAALNFNVIPEMINSSAQDGPVGFYSGSNPMVGYGAGSYILALMERSGLPEMRDCGGSQRN